MDHIWSFLFPPRCLYCGLFCATYLCSQCKKLLRRYAPECYLTRIESHGWLISADQKNNTSLEAICYFYHYQEPIKSLIAEVKYGFTRAVIPVFVELLDEAEAWRVLEHWRVNLITSVPLTPNRYSWRGFNQSEKFAKLISNRTQIPYANILLKIKDTVSQAELNREQRLQNLQSCYAVADFPLPAHEQRILIIDDVCTTGATLENCAKAIKKKFPEVKIYGLCLARGD